MTLIDAIKTKRFVMDGALGTELEALVPGDSKIQPKSSPLWSGMVLLEDPDLVKQVHASYIKAGASILVTSTYQISYASLKKYTSLTDREIGDLWTRAVDVAEQAIDGGADAYIVGSLGPYATFLADGSEYTGKYPENVDFEAYHEPLVKHLAANTRVAALGFETIPNYNELKQILSLMTRIQTSKPFYLSFNFQTEDALADGTPTVEVVKYVSEWMDKNPHLKWQFLGLGLNCIDCDKITAIIELINAQWTVPLILYPNLGFVYDEKHDYWSRKDLAKWKRLVREWWGFDNVRVVGGCCGTSPEEIGLVRDSLQQN